jgi:adenosylcobinamide kinase/adenosylcobinamide-phosphate guanylyltransferase
MNPLARRFRDEAGWLAQDLAQVCDQVHLCVAGIPMTVKG